MILRMSLPRIKTLTYVFVVAVTNFVCLYSGWVLKESSQHLVEKVSSTSRRLSQHADVINNVHVPQQELSSVFSKHSSYHLIPQKPHSSQVPSNRKHLRERNYRHFSDRNLVEKNAKILRLLQSFRPIMTRKEIRVLSSILHRFVSEMYNSNIIYFMYGGTLLGSFRHHDVIPWDDDVDFIVSVKQRQRLYKALNNLKPHFFLDVKQKTRWKFYSISSRPIYGYTWSWPFLDISFYQENDTHIWDVDPKFSKTFVYDKNRIFPLTMRPLMDMSIPAPRDSESVLVQNYDPDVCESNTYNHRRENSVPSLLRKSLPCSLLMDKFPFVRRRVIPQGVNETLEVDGRVISWFVDEVDYSVNSVDGI